MGIFFFIMDGMQTYSYLLTFQHHPATLAGAEQCALIRANTHVYVMAVAVVGYGDGHTALLSYG